ncbi:ATP-binding protein, partial [Candidatus Bipolaricaulota bacterium]|nr:ATP-binding protein [Candidatus Bipolaricaulota bacterium]
KGNIKLLAMGKIYDFGEGCACPINALSSRFLEILELKDDEFLIADTDAGIEHLGRGVEKGCDLILVVVEPSQESIRLAAKIAEMAKSIDKPVYYILNKIDSKTEGLLLEALDGSRVIAAVPQDERILQYGLEGRELALNVEGIEELADFLCGLKN